MQAFNESETRIDRILTSPSTKYWIKNALLAALGDDCDAALEDAELLAQVLRERRDAIAALYRPRLQRVA